VLKAGRRDAAARGSGSLAPIFTALAESYKRQARLSEQSRELLEKTSAPSAKFAHLMRQARQRTSALKGAGEP
jgi:hypothetical protein